MAVFAIYVMTAVAVAVFALSIATSRQNLYSAKNLFLATWLYYGFSVGLDLITGADIPYKLGESNLLDPLLVPDIAQVMWYYMLCGCAFLVTYHAWCRPPGAPTNKTYAFKVPPAWFLIAFHLVVAHVYVVAFLEMDRMARMALAQTSTQHKLLALVVPLALAFDIAIIINCDDSRARLAWVLSLIISLITGNRVYVLLAFLVAVYRWRPKLMGWKLLSMAASCGVVLFSFKLAYAVVLAWWHGGRIDLGVIHENMQLSLSALDAQASYLICLFHLHGASPLWMGSSYYEIPFQLTWPRFLGGGEVSTLAESYVRTHHHLIATRGGGMAFSAIAEAWLNFGWLGTILLGNIWGTAARFFDRRARGICYYIFLILTVRLFRSDFATLYKNWIVVWGSLFLLAVFALVLYTVLTEARQFPQHGSAPRLDPRLRLPG